MATTIIGQSFENERIEVADGTRFVGCTFCNVAIDGGRDVTIDRCCITADERKMPVMRRLANKLISHLVN